MNAANPDIGLKLPGYEIVKEIGRGGVSTVYLARHELLDRQVAIKVISPVLAVEEGFNKRFVREGQTIAQFRHAGIVTVYDVALVDHRPFIAMEYLPGGSLKDRLKEAIPPGQAVAWLGSVADSLGYAHARGVFHRDVKPENILFRENGEPVLTDFGIAKTDAQDTALTSVGVVVGTPRYISPEQAQGHDSDARSDIYALGVMFHEMLTGRPPYDVKGSMSLLYAHINDPIPQLPEELSGYQGLLEDLLAKDPERRVNDCGALVQRLEALNEAGPRRRSPVPRSLPPATRRVGLKWWLAGLAVPVVALMLWSSGMRFELMPQVGEENEFKQMVSRLLSAGDGSSAANDASRRAGGAASESPAAGVESGPRADALQEGAPPQGAQGAANGGGQSEAPAVDAQAAFERAQQRFHGRGASLERSEAVRLYKQAASAGHARAQYYLGVAYGNGEGVKRNEAEALRWLNTASSAGVRGATYNLILGKIFGPDRNVPEAARLAHELAHQGYQPVYRILGWMYNTGAGVDSSFSQSLRWNVKAMMGNVTGKAGAPERVVRHWERRLENEVSRFRAAQSSPSTPVLR